MPYALCPMPYALCPMPYAHEYLIFRSKCYILAVAIQMIYGDRAFSHLKSKMV